jgi:DNA primase
MTNCNDIQQVRLSDTEVVAIFPEAKQIVPALIKELNSKRKALVLFIGNQLAVIKAESKDEVYRYFWRLWLMLNEGNELQEVDSKLARLNRLLRIIQGKPTPKGTLPDDMVQAAREVPIEGLLDQQTFRRSGYNFTALCPLHDDHDPSLRIYKEQNRAWCYVCNDGGDSIKLYMLMNGCDFKTAVMELAGGVA